MNVGAAPEFAERSAEQSKARTVESVVKYGVTLSEPTVDLTMVPAAEELEGELVVLGNRY